MKTTDKEVETTIIENEYPNHKDFAVISKLEKHTFVNHAETRDEAEKIAESQKVQLEQIYSIDTSTAE